MSQGPARLRALLGGDGIAAAPGVHDALSARIVEQAGHPAVYLGGNAMALGLGKGQPFITLTETAELTARVARSVELPVIVDAGAGFGEAAHLDIAVREIEAAGAAALHIDDQPYPKRAAYHQGKSEVAPVALFARRIETAVRARRANDLVVIARTDALRVTRSLDDAIARCRAGVRAGADAVMVLDLRPDQASLVSTELPGVPLVWIGGVTPPVPTLADLAGAGFRLALYPFNGIAAVSAALSDLWAELARTGGIGQADELLARARRDTLALAGMERAFAIEAGPGEG